MARYAEDLGRHVWPMIVSGGQREVIDSEYPLDDAAAAHARMESSGHIGKIAVSSSRVSGYGPTCLPCMGPTILRPSLAGR